MARPRSPHIEEVKNRLRRRLTEGVHRPGDRFLSAREVAAQFGVSYQSAHRLIGELGDEGLLERRAASGTFIPGGRLWEGAHLFFSDRARRADSFGARLLSGLTRRLARDGVPHKITLGAAPSAKSGKAWRGFFPTLWEAPEVLQRCLEARRPALLLNQRPQPGLSATLLDSISIDDFSGGAGAAQLLLGFLAGTPSPLPVSPFGASPMSASPMSATPMSATPMSATPMSATPMSATPMSATPFGTTPFGTTPFGTTPLGTSPLGATPLGATPLGATPTAVALHGESGTHDGIAVLAGPAEDARSQARVSGFLSEVPGARVWSAGSWFFEDGYASAPVLWRGDAPRGLFCVNDRLADGVATWCRDTGHPRPPLIGFDNAPVAQTLGLTTMAIPWDEFIAGASDLLKRRLGGDAGTARQLILTPRPIVRL